MTKAQIIQVLTLNKECRKAKNLSISGENEYDPFFEQSKEEKTEIELKSLILAQIERWRHALHMQVERQHRGLAL